MAAERNRETDQLLAQPDSEELSERRTQPQSTFRRAVVWVLIVEFVSAFPYYLLVAPKLKLLELTICRIYYDDHNPTVVVSQPLWPGYTIEESLCKQRVIQQGLSDLRSWSAFLEGLCALVLSLPYGALADKIGRKFVLLSSMAGLLLSNIWFLIVCTFRDSFSITSILWSNVFLVIGGGTYVLFAITVTMGTDVATKEERSTVLYWLLSANILAYATGAATATAIMEIAWLPFALSVAITVCAAFIACFMPSTTTKEPETSSGNHDVLALDSTVAFDDQLGPEIRSANRLYQSLSKGVSTLKDKKRLLIVLMLFPLMASRGPLSELVLPYSSKRYGWPLRWAGSLDTMNGAIGLSMNAIVIPRSLSALRNCTSSSVKADIIIACYSASAICLGSAVVGLAPVGRIMLAGWTCYSTGSGVRMAVVAVATAFVPPQAFARLNTLIVTVETVADFTISPLLWKAWSAALDSEVIGLGLPWFITAIAYLIVVAILLLVPWDHRAEMEGTVDVPEHHD